jgi:hypothetical protein
MLECWNAGMVSAQDTTRDVWETEALKAAAIAMRHSSKTQASAAYDKGASDKRVSAAMKVAAEYSARFSASSSSK